MHYDPLANGDAQKPGSIIVEHGNTANSDMHNDPLANGDAQELGGILVERGDTANSDHAENLEHNNEIQNKCDVDMDNVDSKFKERQNKNGKDTVDRNSSLVEQTNATEMTDNGKYNKSKEKKMYDLQWLPVLTADDDLQMVMTINKSSLRNRKASTPNPTIEEASRHLTSNGVVHKTVQSKELAKGGFRFYFCFNDTESKKKAHSILTDFYNENYGIDIGELKGGVGDRYRFLLPTLVKIRRIVETKGNLDENAFNILYQVSLTLGLGTDSPSRISMIQEHLRKLSLAFPEKSLGASENKNNNDKIEESSISKEGSAESSEENTVNKKNDVGEKNVLDNNLSNDQIEEIMALRNNSNIVMKAHYESFDQVLEIALSKQEDQGFSETQRINFMNWQDMIKVILNPKLPRQQPRQKPPKTWPSKSWLANSWRRPSQNYNNNHVRSLRRPFDYWSYPLPPQQPHYDEFARYDRWCMDRRWTDNYYRPSGIRDWSYAPYCWEGQSEWACHKQRKAWRYRSMFNQRARTWHA